MPRADDVEAKFLEVLVSRRGGDWCSDSRDWRLSKMFAVVRYTRWHPFFFKAAGLKILTKAHVWDHAV